MKPYLMVSVVTS